MTFDGYFFCCSSQQSELYEGTFQSVVESVLQGYNGTIFAYGQTGTGKSFVIRGTQFFFFFLNILFVSEGSIMFIWLYNSINQEGIYFQNCYAYTYTIRG